MLTGGGASGCENEGPSSPIQLPGAPLFFCFICGTSKQDFIFSKVTMLKKFLESTEIPKFVLNSVLLLLTF